jgi:uncharacterized protein YdeI (YjbR/CyaY-like superfamily)
MKPKFFASRAAFRSWLEKHHADTKELLVAYYKKGSGRPSITYLESVEEALCFGWIDGVQRSIDDISYSIRFTPRRERSSWSAVNIKRVEKLEAEGRMHPSGLAAFDRRSKARSGVYSYEQRHSAKLEPAHEQRFRANRKAWDYFVAQPAGYRTMAIWWVVSAKKKETRLRRLDTLIEDSAHGRAVGPLRRPTAPG